MRAILLATLAVAVSSQAAAGCITTAAGRTICGNGAGTYVAGHPATMAAPGAVVAAPGAAVAPRPVVAGHTYASGVSTVHGAYGGAAAYNPRTGNAAVAQTNARGVTTTHTSRGGQAVTKNGMGVAQGAGGKTCVRGPGQTKCN
ncbi:MAG TPA: hypothetical protein VGH03_09690 [Caulobacteraceae bacterium]|jgi:hypothetical protein